MFDFFDRRRTVPGNMGARLFVIDRYGSDVPQTDQWYAEGERVLLPYQQGELRPSVFLEPHNEHRIACTRALLLSLFILNGQWDARLECVVNAAIFSVLAALAFVWAQDVLPRWWQLMWLVSLALFAAGRHSELDLATIRNRQ